MDVNETQKGMSNRMAASVTIRFHKNNADPMKMNGD